jgi:hypothetical protein
MKTFLKNLLISLLSKMGYSPLFVDKSVLDLENEAMFVVTQIKEKFQNESGEFKRAQAVRMLSNIRPKAAGQDIGLSIELAVKKCSTR